MANISKRDIFNFVASLATETPEEFNPEFAEYCVEAVAKMDEANAKAAEKAKAKRAEAGPSNVSAVNEQICADAVAVIDGAMTRDQIFEAMGGADYTYTKADGSEAPLSVQKLSTAMKGAVDAGTIVKEFVLVDGNKKTAYKLA